MSTNDDFNHIDPKMQDAMDELTCAGIDFEQTSQYQLKIGDLNYYPAKGTIFRDGDKKALKERGLDALLKLIAEQHRRRGQRRHGPSDGPGTIRL
jgi:hypothetical protein